MLMLYGDWIGLTTNRQIEWRKLRRRREHFWIRTIPNRKLRQSHKRFWFFAFSIFCKVGVECRGEFWVSVSGIFFASMSGVGWKILAMSGVGITPFMGPCNGCVWRQPMANLGQLHPLKLAPIQESQVQINFSKSGTSATKFCEKKVQGH